MLPSTTIFPRFKSGLILSLLALASAPAAQAQDVPRIYPAPAPTALDTARGAADLADKQQFANPSVLGMGPSKGIILHYERTTPFSVAASSQVAGVSDYNTDARRNGRLIFKGYIPA